MRVVDPDGVEWEVTRRWLHVPRWWRRRPDLGDMPDVGLPLDEAPIAVAVVLLVLLVLVLLFGLPFLLFPLALLVAVGGLLVRVVFRRPWLVEARSERGELAWRVRGALGSRRAMLELARAFAQGERGYSPPAATRVLPEPILKRSR